MARKRNNTIDIRTPKTAKAFEQEVLRADQDGFTAYNEAGEVFFSSATSMYCAGFGDAEDPGNPISQRRAQEQAMRMAYDEKGMEIQGACSCGDGRRSGVLMSNDATMLDWSQNQFVKIDGCGTPGLGYAVWGPFNAWPLWIFRSASSNPLTASVIDYLKRTLFGLGPQVVYCISRYSGGTVTHEEVPYHDAEIYLRERVKQLTNQLVALLEQEEPEEEAPAVGDSLLNAIIDPLKPKPEETKAQRYKRKRIEDAEKELDKAKAELESYYTTRAEMDRFLDENNLSDFLKKWVDNFVHYGICFPMVGLGRGRYRQAWEPKIQTVDFRDSVIMRLEERNPNNGFKIDYVYESERWREETNCVLHNPDYVAHPSIMPEHALRDLQSKVAKHRNASVGKRPLWWCCPNYQPTTSKPYYPQLSWWSIYPSQVYQFSSTIIYDKATAKKNSTMWGKILFINTAYLAQIFNQAGEEGKTPEGQAKIRREIYNNVEQFLKRRDNNGKLLVMDSYPSADEKQMIDSIRIVDVPQNADVKASVSELTEMASLISYAFGVNIDLIGSRPGTEAKSTGTAQRELHLLKNGQLSPDRVTFTDFFNRFVFRFNQFDPHFRMVVNYPTLTTLDNSKTGTVDMHDGN